MAGSELIYQCPDCSRPVVFRNPGTNILLCSCGTVLNRKEGGVILAKPLNLILDKVGLIQPGTRGKWGERNFEVLGRFRVWTEEAVQNYWTILLDGGTLLWLVEGYGLYAIHERTELVTLFRHNGTPGEEVKFSDSETYTVQCREECFRWDFEGELMIPETGSGFRIFDYANMEGRRLQRIEFLKGYQVIYSVAPAKLEELHLKNTRAYANPGREFTCTQCSSRIFVKTYPFSQSFVCNQCHTRYSLENSINIAKEKGKNETAIIPSIPIGKKGEIRGIEYEVLGYAVKEERNEYHAQWTEYTLFHPAEGFAFLSEFNGHWIYLRESTDTPILRYVYTSAFEFGGSQFELFNSYTYNLIEANGEFPYNIFDDPGKSVREYICPPEMWTCERSKHEGIEWFKGDHISEMDLKSAFGAEIILPEKIGIGAVEPRGNLKRSKVVIAALLGIAALLAIHFGFSNFFNRQQVILDRNLVFIDTLNNFSLIVQPIKLDKRSSNLEFQIHAPVRNSWFELEATLVDINRGTEYTVTQGVEYYTGVSDGEQWTEGKTSETAYLNQIPAGNYILQIHGRRDDQFNKTYDRFTDFDLKVIYDVPNHKNLLICLGLLLLWPVYQYNRSLNTEKRRWSDSNYSKYEQT